MSERCEARIPRRWLLDRFDGTLAPARSEKLAAHLAAGCSACEAGLAAIERTLAAVAAGPLPAPPRAVARRAKRLYSRRRREEVVANVRRVVARLVFDEGRELVPELRSTPGRTRRILWSTGDHELFATFVSARKGWDFLGEVMPVDDDDREVSGEVSLLFEGRERQRRMLDTEGRFTFRSLPSGGYSLEGTVEGTSFVVPSFVLD